MAKKGIRYSKEFRDDAVEMVLTRGLTMKQVAQELGVSYGSVVLWVKKARQALAERSNEVREVREAEDASPVEGSATSSQVLTTPVLTDNERAELEWLRRENATLRDERAALIKAAAVFARELR